MQNGMEKLNFLGDIWEFLTVDPEKGFKLEHCK